MNSRWLTDAITRYRKLPGLFRQDYTKLCRLLDNARDDRCIYRSAWLRLLSTDSLLTWVNCVSDWTTMPFLQELAKRCFATGIARRCRRLTVNRNAKRTLRVGNQDESEEWLRTRKIRIYFLFTEIILRASIIKIHYEVVFTLTELLTLVKTHYADSSVDFS